MRGIIRQHGSDTAPYTTYFLNTNSADHELDATWGERMVLDIPPEKLDAVLGLTRGFKGPRATFNSRMRELLDS